MPITITMPALSPTMTEGTLAKWLVKVGDPIAPGQVIAEIETDKATMEVEAVDEGTVSELLVAAGTEGVAVNTPIAVVLAEGEAKGPSRPSAPAKAPAAPPAIAAPAAAQPPAATNGSGQAPGQSGRLFVSPLAKRMAAQAGLDLAALKGSGPHGRIVKADIDQALAAGKAQPAALALATPPPAARLLGHEVPFPLEAPFELVPLTAMRRTIARRMQESKQQAPHFYMTVDCEIDALLKLRQELNERGEAKLTVNDLLIKLAAMALMKVPAANAAWADGGIKFYKSADISVAVSTDRGLVTPVVRQAEQKGLARISQEMAALAAKARDGKLLPEDYQGGTFTISNLGMFGIKQFEAVLNPPQACILAIGAGEKRPAVKHDALAIATMMSCTLSVDHRSADGTVGARYLAAFKKLVEDPMSMLL